MLAVLLNAPPDPNSVVAGWRGAVVFAALIIATALLCWSFTRQLRKANRAKEEGVFGDDAAEQAQGETKAEDAETEPHDTDA